MVRCFGCEGYLAMTDAMRLKWILKVMKNLRESYKKQHKEDVVVVLDHLIEMAERKNKNGSVSA